MGCLSVLLRVLKSFFLELFPVKYQKLHESDMIKFNRMLGSESSAVAGSLALSYTEQTVPCIQFSKNSLWSFVFK